MCKAIAELLGTSRDHLHVLVHDLESASGYPSNDVRLSAEIVGKVFGGTRALGLDPTDTTGPELYQALINLAGIHDDFLLRRLGLSNVSEVHELSSRIVHFVNKLNVPKKVWVVKHVAIKRILKQQVPRRAMKALGYRSLDSLLKREPMGKLVLLLPLLESEHWYELFVQRYQQLTPVDFEQRHVEILSLDGPEWHLVAQELNALGKGDVIANKELGVVALVPYTHASAGFTITRLPTILHELSELRLHSAYLKLMQTRPNFGQLVCESVSNGRIDDVYIAGHAVSWRTIHKHIVRDGQLPEVFEPHVATEDFEHYKTEELLYKLEPALHFWHEMEYVGVYRDGQAISFNLLDAARNYAQQKPFSKQTTTYLKTALSDQLLLRYLSLPHVESRVFTQLDYQVFDPELLALSTFEDF
jgi:hypothetical protein